MEAGSESSSSSLDEVVDAFLDDAEDGARAAVQEELTAAALAPEERAEQLEAFYSTTVGAVFVWTLENLVAGLLHLAVYVVADALLGGSLWIVQWCSCCTLAGAAVMAGLNTLYAFTQREPGVLSREYMMITQAYCGTVSYVSVVFSGVAWEAAKNAHWNSVFLQSSGSLTAPVLIAVVVMNNAAWLLSLVLTYSCTPFGQSNSAFLQLPVGAALLLFLVLVNEMATNDARGDPATFAAVNGAICSSAVLEIFSALEVDPLHLFPDALHSSLHTRARIDPWALLHGSALLFFALGYGAVARFSQTSFFGVVFVLAFLLGVTVLQGVDTRYVLGLLLRTSDEDERRVRAMQGALAEAVAQPAAKPALIAKPAPIAKARRRRRHAEPDHAMLRAGRASFRDTTRLPSAVAVFPHIPVSLRREAY